MDKASLSRYTGGSRISFLIKDKSSQQSRPEKWLCCRLTAANIKNPENLMMVLIHKLQSGVVSGTGLVGQTMEREI